MADFPPRDPRTNSAVFDVWLAESMLFNNPPGYTVKRYRKYTKAKKVRYSKSDQMYLDALEERASENSKGRAVAVEVGGKVRYMWRSDVLTREEYDEVQKKQKIGLGKLRKKQHRNVGKGGA